MTDVPVLTIDGPSGAGKGTVSRLIAKRLGWHFLDSGAIYRALAWAVRRRGVDLDDEDAVARVASDMKLEFVCNDAVRVIVDGEDVTDRLATEDVGRIASKIAAYPKVRQALLEKQRAFRRPPGLVADGRDMGTVVFPDAPCKVFLTASAEERARRRFLQLKAQGLDVNLDQIIKDLEERDRRDRERKESPLVPAGDAVVIDSSNLTVDEVVERILARLPQALKSPRGASAS
ncbi:CMP/dCMP kinase [Methylomarinovum tepidoasis]|uniref:Cytidylate kinase n=1 Tax=Methylomarinovum tepidoasis TaxID=2840183 RepID=A0AAU9C6K4_9GAMM|nr:(d)CMP kinase [Methylomarinovum sp. IN45]BCX89187.1 CMP/dCMP kinase [Methylomarinovum sp. IN45]